MAMPRVDTNIGGWRISLNVAMFLAMVMLQVLDAAQNGGNFNVTVGPGTVNDWCLVFFIQTAMLNSFIRVGNLNDAVYFSVFGVLLHGCLVGFESVDKMDLAQKALTLLVVTASLDYFKNV